MAVEAATFILLIPCWQELGQEEGEMVEDSSAFSLHQDRVRRTPRQLVLGSRA
jgi:hypothetical protein